MRSHDSSAEQLPPGEQAHRDAIIERACQAFDRDCPELLPEHAGQWVAYHGDHRIAIGPTRAELWQECLRRGLPDGEFWLFSVQPVIGVEVMGMGGATIECIDP
jgi:hypothetical protein